jgi:hypothetical protein
MKCTFPLLLLAVIALANSAFAAQPSDPELDKAVAVLRKIAWKDWSDEQKETKAKEIDAAWKTLSSAGEKGAARLKQEIEKIDTEKEKDDFFKLNAAVVLWEIGKVSEAEYIAKVWESADLSSQYTYVFFTAFDAARTQDPKVLPMLRVVSRDDKGAVFIGAHAMNVGWPLSHEFIWGVYGNGALPILAEALEGSTNEIELKTAMKLLGNAQYLPALPRIRQLAVSERPEVRRIAIQTIGAFGHPDDYDRLLAGIRASRDPKELFAYAFALYEFEDERAVPHLIPMLGVADESLQVEASLALLHLLTPDSYAAVRNFVPTIKNLEVKKFLERSLTLRSDKLPKNFDTLGRTDQAKLLSDLRNSKYVLKPGEQPISNAKLIEALKTWKEKGRIYDSGFDWIGERGVIASATPNEIGQILATISSFYKRLSDECLYEVRDLQTAVKYIGRSRYRRGVGITSRAELK